MITRDRSIGIGHHPNGFVQNDFATIGWYSINPVRQWIERKFAQILVAARRNGAGPKVGAQWKIVAVRVNRLFNFGDCNAAVLRAVNGGAQKRVIAPRNGARDAATRESAAAISGEPFVEKSGRGRPIGDHWRIFFANFVLELPLGRRRLRRIDKGSTGFLRQNGGMIIRS